MSKAFLLLLVCLPFGVQVARADTAAEARTAYAQGRAFYKAGQYSEAAAELKRAYELKPHPVLLKYMGDSYYKLNKAKVAIRLYKRYLKEAPMAADRATVESRVRQLELIVGASDEEERPAPAPVPAPVQPAVQPPPPVVAPPPPAPGRNLDLAPTGEDREMPVALRKRTLDQSPPRARPPGTNLVKVFAWTTMGLSVASLALGITFNRLAAGSASDLEFAARNDCPRDPNDPGKMIDCGGNPDLNDPKVPYSKEHYELLSATQRNQTISLVGFIAGGAFAATSIVLFVVDKPSRERRAARSSSFSLAPAIGGGTYGVAGGVTF